jgi:diguanylate cyclase (GGDEF)-like protein
MLNKGYTGIYYYIIAMSAIILSVIKEIFFQDNLSYLPFGAFIMIVAFSLMTIEEFVSIAKQNQILSSEIALDKLTSVKNRNFLETYLNQLVERDYVNDCYLLFLDLDRFKPINDVYGHAVGDDVLRMVAKRLQGILRSNDLLGRYGGDEFVIIIDNQSMKDVQKIVNRMITTINTAMLIDERHYYVGVSVGICKYERDWTASQWLAYGDMAMYRAKKSGGNRYVIFEDHMKTEVLESTSDI